MSQAAKVQEPSMEEILASIRRIIADDEGPKSPAKPAEPAPPARPTSPTPEARSAPAAEMPPPEPPAMSQDDIDAMLAGFEVRTEESPSERKPPEESPDVLELTEAMEARPAPASPPSFRPIEPSSDVVFTDEEPAPEPRRFRAAAPEAEPEPVQATRPLLSQHATAAVTSAFGNLAHTVLAQNARTLEDLVGEMLRPMLKSWLDDNLPTIVERLVRAEIERVSRGRG